MNIHAGMSTPKEQEILDSAFTKWSDAERVAENVGYENQLWNDRADKLATAYDLVKAEIKKVASLEMIMRRGLERQFNGRSQDAADFNDEEIAYALQGTGRF